MKRFPWSVVLSIMLLTYSSSALAAWSPTYEERVLFNLYTTAESLSKPDVYIEKRIADARAKIRKATEGEAQKMLTMKMENNGEKGKQSTVQTLDEATNILQSIEERIRVTTVDRELLEAEEKQYAQQMPSQLSEGVRLTNSLVEAKTRIAIAEEQRSAWKDALDIAEKRVGTLQWNVRLEQGQKMMGVLSYAFILMIAILIDRWIKRRFVRTIEDNYRRYLLSKLISGSIYLFAIFIILTKILFDHPNALASLAIVGAGFAIAMQDVIKDVFGWVIIVNRHLYSLGNRVSIGQYTGDVIDIGLLRTTMREVLTQGVANPQERAGKILFLPNAMVLREPVLNFNAASDYFGVELSMVLTHQSNWKKAESILLAILEKHVASFAKAARAQQKRRTALFFTFSEVRDPTVDIGIDIKGITLSLKFTVPIGSKQKIFSSIWRDILDQFAKEDDLHFAKE